MVPETGTKPRSHVHTIARQERRSQAKCVSETPTRRATRSAAPARVWWAKVFAVLLVLQVFVARVEAAVQIDATSSTSSSAVSSLTWSHTVANQSDRILIVVVGAEQQSGGGAIEPSTVTYGGQTLTKVVTNAAGTSIYGNASLWYVLAPTVGTANVVVTDRKSVV